MFHRIDLNCDMGEGYGAWAMGQDEALLEQVQTEVALSAPEPMQPLEKLVKWNSPSGQSASSQ